MVREFLSPAELAREVGISAPRLRGLCLRGKVPGARRLGGRWVIHRPAFVASFAGPTPPGPRLVAPPKRLLTRSDLARIADSV